MQTNNAEAVGQAAALNSVVPALERLKRLLADARASKLRALRDFATDNLDLQRLEEMLAQAKAQPAEFDLFEVLNLWWQEDVHSRTLTWLLNPNGSHGVSDYFLKNFLLASGSLSGGDATGDWSKAESQREWYCVVDGGAGWLDILVVDHDNKFLCAVENKVFSPEGGRQLTHYRKALEAAYPNFTRHYVFLSPGGMESQWEDEREHWMPMTYTTILELVEQTIEDNAAKMSEDVRVFLRQYANALRRMIVPETSEVQQLAREIYLKHRVAIELIIRHKPNLVDEAKNLFKEAIQRQENWKLDHRPGGLVGFSHVKWGNFDVFRTGTTLGSKALVQFAFDTREEGRVMLILTILPGNEESARRRLFEAAQNSPLFDSKGHRFGGWSDSWIRLHVSETILDESDFDNWGDQESIRAKIRAWVADFAENQFPPMNDVIVNCLREYDAETQGQ